ncbi:cell death-inducing p53-target protein 1 homolog [Cyprinodon tularosa]|uniref:cell death-inducing p53-target protein 1 homolog n=1 Tax=Cyprinodon tularosa TaxID=77115 RepID=UPI0018E20385|nr:cell death-inducing p53-target protein 1 homolog [Cyprinodon tularosa]
MEKGEGPPLDSAVVQDIPDKKMGKDEGPPPVEPDIPNSPAPPYPGSPLDSNMQFTQPDAVQYQQSADPPYPQHQFAQPDIQQYPQAFDQQYPQQQFPQPDAQQYQQTDYQQYHEQQFPQPDAQQFQPQYVMPVQQPQSQPQQQQPQVVQIVNQHHVVQPMNQPAMVVQQMPTEHPGTMICPHCRSQVVTVISYKVGCYTWIIVGVLFAFLCWPCCLIPFCCNSCKDVEHSCPQCHNKLYTYERK